MAKKKTKAKRAVKCTVTVVDAVTNPDSGEVKVSRRKVETRLSPKPRPADLRNPFYTVNYIAHKTGVHAETVKRELRPGGGLQKVSDEGHRSRSLIPASIGRPFIQQRTQRQAKARQQVESNVALTGLAAELEITSKHLHKIADRMKVGSVVGDRSVRQHRVFTEDESDAIRRHVLGLRAVDEEFDSMPEAAAKLSRNTKTVRDWVTRSSAKDEESGEMLPAEIPFIEFMQDGKRTKYLPKPLVEREKREGVWAADAKKRRARKIRETADARHAEQRRRDDLMEQPRREKLAAEQKRKEEFDARVSEVARRVRAPERKLRVIAGGRLPQAVDVFETILSQRLTVGDEADTAQMLFSALTTLDDEAQGVLLDHALRIPPDLRHQVFWRIVRPTPNLPRDRVIELVKKGNYSLKV